MQLHFLFDEMTVGIQVFSATYSSFGDMRRRQRFAVLCCYIGQKNGERKGASSVNVPRRPARPNRKSKLSAISDMFVTPSPSAFDFRPRRMATMGARTLLLPGLAQYWQSITLKSHSIDLPFKNDHQRLPLENTRLPRSPNLSWTDISARA